MFSSGGVSSDLAVGRMRRRLRVRAEGTEATLVILLGCECRRGFCFEPLTRLVGDMPAASSTGKAQGHGSIATMLRTHEQMESRVNPAMRDTDPNRHRWAPIPQILQGERGPPETGGRRATDTVIFLLRRGKAFAG
jgi:hypothetical protein